MMNKFVWVLQVLLALLFVMPGFMKVSTPTPELLAQMGQPADASVLHMRILGALELLGVAGIILPWLLRILPVLTPITAACFALVMVGAIPLHTMKGDYAVLPMLVAALAASVFVAWYRWRELRHPAVLA